MNLPSDQDPLDLLDITDWHSSVEMYDNKQLLNMYNTLQSSNATLPALNHSAYHRNILHLQPNHVHHRSSFTMGHVMHNINPHENSSIESSNPHTNHLSIQSNSNNATNNINNINTNNISNQNISLNSNSISSNLNQNEFTETDNGANSTSISNSNNIRKNSNTLVPTIASVYEPKFIDIYNTYKSFVLKQQINLDLNFNDISKHHLMTLCLNNLLTFSNWARDSANSEYIRTALFENQDLRPEVRNGLAMILVYTFSAALSHDMKANSSSTNNLSNLIDMFGIISKPEIGMGIMNKTSLKIYSDPFGYFNFIKTCISGLIDASAIPENERNNIQQTKKIRRGSKNRDEVQAFEYIKNSLVAMFESGETQIARSKINQILEYWHIKGKSVRNERFSSIFCLPAPPINNSISSSSEPSSSTNPNNSIQQPTLSTGPRKSFLIQNTSTNTSNGDNESVNSETNSSPYNSFYEKPNSLNSSNNSSGNGSNFLHRYTNVSNISMNSISNEEAYNTSAKKNSTVNSIPIPCMKLNRLKPLSWSGIVTFIYDLDSLNAQIPSATFYLIDYNKLRKYLKNNKIGEELLYNEKDFKKNNYETSHETEDSSAESPNNLSPISFDIPIDDVYSGVTTLEKLLIKSKSLITLWSPIEYLQLRFFINSWRQNNNFALNSENDLCNQSNLFDKNSLFENRIGQITRRKTTGAIEIENDINKMYEAGTLNKFPNSSNLSLQSLDIRNIYNTSDSSNENSPVVHSPDVAGRKRFLTQQSQLNLIEYWNLLNPSSKSGTLQNSDSQAMLLYEKSCEIGIVIRMNKNYNINEDIWCLFYPELKIRNQSNTTFFQFLNQLFPHISFFQDHNNKSISLGYYSHNSQNNSSIPSAPNSISQYRSIGNINDSFFNIYSLLSHDATFHDFILY